MIKSPGVPAEAPPVVRARERGIPVWSEIELGWRLLAPRPFIGVTGTKGKTTTTELLGAMFRAAGRPVEVAGNVGRPLTSVEASEDAWIVCELSSFQLEDVHELELEIAILLNLAPDHLDRHGTFEAYRDAKLRIFERARTRIVPPGYEGRRLHSRRPAARRARAAGSAQPRQRGGRHGSLRARHRSRRMRLPRRCGPSAASRTGSSSVAERRDVRWVNDSIATNTFAVLAGAGAFDAPVRLILGGQTKGEDYARARARPARERRRRLPRRRARG